MAKEVEVKNASLILEENRELFETLTRKFRLTKEEVETTKEKVKGFLDVDLLPHLHSVTMGLLTVGSIKGFCRPPISHFSATAISEGEKGEWSFGVNLEFEGHPLNASVHAEQFSISNLYMGGEHKLIRISTSPAPCGHCRQFMNECNGREDLIVQMNRMEGSSLFLTLTSLPQLLPYNFSPKDLGCKILLLQNRAESGEPELPVTLISSSSTSSTSSSTFSSSSSSQEEEETSWKDLEEKAKTHLDLAYAPHTQSPSSVVIEMKEGGETFSGVYMENAAYNPSLSPLHVALSQLVASHRSYSDIGRVLLLEKRGAPVSHRHFSQAIVSSISPSALFHTSLFDSN